MTTETETLTNILSSTLARLVELGEAEIDPKNKAYIFKNYKLMDSPFIILKDIELNTLLTVFHNSGPGIKALVASGYKSPVQPFDISEDETHLVFEVHELGVEHQFEIVIYNRHGEIGIEAEFDAAPALNEDLAISIWDDLSGKFEFATSLNHALNQSGLDKHYSFPIDEFVKLYLEEINMR